MAMAAGAAFFGRFPLDLSGPHPYAPQRAPGYYPPALTGLRGSHPGSYEVAHRIRDGGLDAMMRSARPSGEKYDLVVVGGGISGLTAAHFFQKARRRPASWSSTITTTSAGTPSATSSAYGGTLLSATAARSRSTARRLQHRGAGT